MTSSGKTKLRLIIGALIVLMAALLFLAHRFEEHSDVLWKFVSQQCVPDMEQNHQPAPCEKVDLAAGYVLFKDRVGPLQYLLMPVSKITGIESPQLLEKHTANFFALAWHERHLLSDKNHSPVPDSDLAMTINSASGRTQNQLHIHMSCLRADIGQQLAGLSQELTEKWQPLTLRSHPYLARTLTPTELDQQSVFLRIAREIPGAAGQMGDYGLALTALPDGRLVLLAIKKQLLKGNTGSAEELQDHQCGILKTDNGAGAPLNR